MAVIRWDNVGISNNNSGTGATVAGIRGWEGTTDSILDLADRVKTSKTDQALAAMSADGVLSRDEIGQAGPGVDMKTILDAQRLDQTSREATETGKLSNALTEQQRVKAARENSPEYIKKQEEMANAKLEVEKQQAATAAARAKALAAQANISTAEAERLIRERDKKELVQSSFVTDLSKAVQGDFGEGGRYSREVAKAKWLEQKRATLTTDDGTPWEPSARDLDDFNLAYENALPGLTDKAQQAFMRGYLRSTDTAQNAKYLTDLPQYQRWDSTNQAVETAQADVASQAQDRVDDLFKGIEKSKGAYITEQNGRYTLTDESQAVPSKEKASYKANLFSTIGLEGDETIKSSTYIDPGKKSEDLTNNQGFDQLFSAAGGHTQIIEDILKNPEIVNRTDRWVPFMDDETWIDWSTAIDAAKERKKTMDAEAERQVKELPRNVTEQASGNPIFQLNL